MMNYLELENGESLYSSKIVCIARNYVAHIKELNNVTPSKPTFFIKPNSSLANEGQRVLLPNYSNSVHHEIELAIVIGKSGKKIPKEKAYDYIMGYGVAVDLTARDVQAEMKKNGFPWEAAKAFDQSCPISKIKLKDDTIDPQNLSISCSVNQELRQDGNTNLMIYKIDEIIAAASEMFTLHKGDVIMTGTPEGVGKLESGDILTGEVEGVAKIHIEFS